MAEQTADKLNSLERELPEGLLVDSQWLTRRGYKSALRTYYVSNQHLEQPTRRVYRRPRGSLKWEQVVISLQTILLRSPLTVGGRTALEFDGLAHFLKHTQSEVHLYGPKPPPTWLLKLPLQEKFIYHNSRVLFPKDPDYFGSTNPSASEASDIIAKNDLDVSFQVKRWGQWEWPLLLSTPERATLELLNELPSRETFDQVDRLFDGLASLRPRRLEKLLTQCKSVKVKRLFFYFAARHPHAWTKFINREQFDLGVGNRQIVKNGRLDPQFHITVPRDFDAVP